jgi:putative flippase GtrA
MMEKFRALFREKEKLREVVSYLFFGLLTTLVSWLVYIAMTGLLDLGGQAAGSAGWRLIANASNITSWVLAVSFAYITNKRFVFKSTQNKGGAWREFVLFVSARALSMLLFQILLFNLCLLMMDDKLAKLLMNVLEVLFNYFASKFVVFNKKGDA